MVAFETGARVAVLEVVVVIEMRVPPIVHPPSALVSHPTHAPYILHPTSYITLHTLPPPISIP